MESISFEKKFKNWIEDLKANGSYAEENFILQTSEIMAIEMKSRGLSHNKFAKLIGTSTDYLKKMLQGEAGNTIEIRAKFLYSLGYEIKFSFEKIKEKN